MDPQMQVHLLSAIERIEHRLNDLTKQLTTRQRKRTRSYAAQTDDSWISITPKRARFVRTDSRMLSDAPVIDLTAMADEMHDFFTQAPDSQFELIATPEPRASEPESTSYAFAKKRRALQAVLKFPQPGSAVDLQGFVHRFRCPDSGVGVKRHHWHIDYAFGQLVHQFGNRTTEQEYRSWEDSRQRWGIDFGWHVDESGKFKSDTVIMKGEWADLGEGDLADLDLI